MEKTKWTFWPTQSIQKGSNERAANIITGVELREKSWSGMLRENFDR